MFELKLLSHEGIPGALAKAERYRLLNQPWEAECIYRDVLDVDPENQEATVGLVLAITDQFERGSSASAAPGPSCKVPGRVRVRWPTSCYARRRGGTSRLRCFARPAMTMSCSAGTPAPGS